MRTERDNRPELIARLARQEEHLSAALHELTRQRTAIREALTQLRMGRSPRAVSALLDEALPELAKEAS